MTPLLEKAQLLWRIEWLSEPKKPKFEPGPLRQSHCSTTCNTTLELLQALYICTSALTLNYRLHSPTVQLKSYTLTYTSFTFNVFIANLSLISLVSFAPNCLLNWTSLAESPNSTFIYRLVTAAVLILGFVKKLLHQSTFNTINVGSFAAPSTTKSSFGTLPEWTPTWGPFARSDLARATSSGHSSSRRPATSSWWCRGALR